VTTAAPATVGPLPPPAPAAGSTADTATQQRRRLHYVATLAGAKMRAGLLAGGSIRRRRGLQVCSAARLLTALGIRVDVVQPATPWPRHRAHRLRITNSAGVLGDLALLTAVPRTASGWASVADRVLPTGIPLRPADPDPADALACPVVIAYRTETGPLATPPRTLAQVIAVAGLVIEVCLLPAESGADRAA
jgi:hypothetical protein